MSRRLHRNKNHFCRVWGGKKNQSLISKNDNTIITSNNGNSWILAAKSHWGVCLKRSVLIHVAGTIRERARVFLGPPLVFVFYSVFWNRCIAANGIRNSIIVRLHNRRINGETLSVQMADGEGEVGANYVKLVRQVVSWIMLLRTRRHCSSISFHLSGIGL